MCSQFAQQTCGKPQKMFKPVKTKKKQCTTKRLLYYYPEATGDRGAKHRSKYIFLWLNMINGSPSHTQLLEWGSIPLLFGSLVSPSGKIWYIVEMRVLYVFRDVLEKHIPCSLMYDGLMLWCEETNEKLIVEIWFALLAHCQGAWLLIVDDEWAILESSQQLTGTVRAMPSKLTVQNGWCNQQGPYLSRDLVSILLVKQKNPLNSLSRHCTTFFLHQTYFLSVKYCLVFVSWHDSPCFSSQSWTHTDMR